MQFNVDILLEILDQYFSALQKVAFDIPHSIKQIIALQFAVMGELTASVL